MTYRMNPGQPFQAPANAWNRMDEASDAYHRQKSRGDVLPEAMPIAVPTDLIKLKNGTSGDLSRGSVLQLGAYTLTLAEDVAQRFFYFSGQAPTLDHGKHHAVIIGPIPDGEYGPAQLGGVVAARVLVTDVAHAYCLPTAGQTYFTSSPIGPYRLLAAPSSIEEPTEHLLPVALNGGVLTLLADCDEAEGIASGASGTFDIVDGTPGSETSTGLTCEAFNDGPAIGNGDRASLSLINWRVYASLVECSE